MAIVEALLPEFDHEFATTRRVLDRVPPSHFSWKPHDKSMSLGQLAAHVAHIPYWCTATLEADSLDLGAAGELVRPGMPESRESLLHDFDTRLTAARQRLVGTTDPEFLLPWTLKNGGQEYFTMPKISVLRTFVMNHQIHHRGQLTVYLRLNNVPIPPIYGPTADEPA
jgi:uncharacterized damage-inducible protein DinB